MHPRIRRGITLSLQNRWWGLLGVSVQRGVADLILHAHAGADLGRTPLEPCPFIADVVC